jgi:hypothetical protein
MQKKILVVALGSLVLAALAGCTNSQASSNPSEVSSEAPSVSSSQESSVSSAPDYDGVLKAFLAKVEARNLTVEVKDWCNFQFFGKDAIYDTYEAASGYEGQHDAVMRVGLIGVFNFAIDSSNNLVFGNCLTPVSDTNLDLFYYTPDLLASSFSLWTRGEGFSWTSTDKDAVGTALAGLNGYGSSASDFTYKTTLTLAEDGSKASFACTATYNKKDYPLVAEFSALGSTKNEAIDAAIANPPDIPAATAWSADQKSLMTTFSGEAIPFPAGNSYAASFDPQTDDDGNQTGYQYLDFSSGDILADYQAALLSAGWTLSSRTTPEADLKSDGYVHYIYEKTKSEQTTSAGKVVYQLQVEFEPVSAMGDSTQALYPNGEFKIFAGTYEYPMEYTFDAAGLNAYYAKITKTDGSVAIPTLTISDKVTAIKVEDDTKLFNDTYGSWGYSWINYSIATLSVDAEADMQTEVASYGAALVKAGFTDAGKTLAADGCLSYTLSDDKFASNFSGALAILITPAYSTDSAGTKTYAKTFTIVVEA